jgi:hypothetical protein
MAGLASSQPIMWRYINDKGGREAREESHPEIPQIVLDFFQLWKTYFRI